MNPSQKGNNLLQVENIDIFKQTFFRRKKLPYRKGNVGVILSYPPF